MEVNGSKTVIYGLEVALGQPLPDDPYSFRPTKALRKLLQLPRHAESLTLEEFGPFIKQQNDRFGSIARQANIKVQ